MPIPNKNYNWRPNDNGSLTNHRYDLEAGKWYVAFQTAQRDNSPAPSFGSIIAQVGPIVMIPFLVIMWVFLIVLVIFRFFGVILPILPGDKLEAERRKQAAGKKYSNTQQDISLAMEPLPSEIIDVFKRMEGENRKLRDLYQKSVFGTY